MQCRKKQFYVDRASQLQQALANVQVASERRLLMEKRFRSQLERDVENLTAQKVRTREFFFCQVQRVFSSIHVMLKIHNLSQFVFVNSQFSKIQISILWCFLFFPKNKNK